MADTIREIIPDTDNDQTRAREEHLKAIRALVGNAYPNKFRRTNVTESREGEDTITSIVEKFKQHEPQVEPGAKPTPEQLEAANSELNKIEVRVSGRIATPPRVMGKAAFVHLSDGKSRLQIYVRRDDARAVSNDTGEAINEPADAGWQLLQLLDHGDFIGVAGFLFVTKTGELSVHVRELQFLAKALMPMPDKMHGISDPEIGRRRRYVDLIASSLKVEREEGELTTREVFELRSKLITQMRSFLDAHGYVEVETPMLTPIASGAAARPFKTHHNALDIDLYARIAPELYLKRLLVGGFERVYELNRNFRNEGIGYRWNPEFTMLEFYCAYMDVNGMMDFCEEMLRTAINVATGNLQVTFGGSQIDFSKRFNRISMRHAIIQHWKNTDFSKLGNLDIDESFVNESGKLHILANFVRGWEKEAIAFLGSLPEEEMSKEAHDRRLSDRIRAYWKRTSENSSPATWTEETEDAQIGRDIADIFEPIVERYLEQPTFITDFPKLISPLSKASPADPSVAERFELYCAGMEIANGFSELNDPVEQYARFEDQARQRERGDEEAMQTDVDYVRALAYGMPPAAGIGIGVDRLTMLLTNKKSIRDVILFPHMRPQAQKPEDAAPDEGAQPDGESA